MLSVEETHQPERKDTDHVTTLNEGSSSLPLKKRKNEEDAIESSDPSPEQTSSGHENQDAHNGNDPSQNEDSGPPSFKSKSKSPSSMSKSRELRLTQNRKAARESRRRKKMMIEELQRSTIFFSTANQALEQQNNDLSRRLLEAHAEIAKLGEPVAPPDSKLVKLLETLEHNQAPQVEVTGSAPLAGPPSVASNLTVPVLAPVATCSHDLPAMQPGSTMQAMANFQQAATAAMQAAAQGMQALGGLPDTTATASHAVGSSDGQTQKPSPATIVYL
jgi:hypothetical protein